ncbi:hypothetical protein Sru01_44150 [Sphaerisporangium rufum]|uniref:Uncharacterized protein n=1 Tax=Sphaerisporangium rufum TaxID=1381558 RepID=A0A919R5D6_9ACTN|nr:hypothetical protein Sru01_44150 [Sphaerisporangium rufum]
MLGWRRFLGTCARGTRTSCGATRCRGTGGRLNLVMPPPGRDRWVPDEAGAGAGATLALSLPIMLPASSLLPNRLPPPYRTKFR